MTTPNTDSGVTRKSRVQRFAASAEEGGSPGGAAASQTPSGNSTSAPASDAASAAPIAPAQNSVLMHSVESERMLLSIGLNETRVPLLQQLLGLVSRDDFFVEHHGYMWAAVSTLSEMGSPHDIASVLDHCRTTFIGGLEYVAGLADDPLAMAASDEAVLQAARRVKEYATLRRLRDLMQQGMRMCEQGQMGVGDVQAFVEDELSNLRRLSESSHSGPRHLGEILMVAMEHMQNQMDGKVQPATPTGFDDLDRIISGFVDEDLIILAARPSMGKTALMKALARNSALATPLSGLQHGRPSLIFSLESPGQSLGLRLLSSEARVGHTDLKEAKVHSDSDWARISEALETLTNAPVWIDDTPGLTLHELRSRARAFVAKHGKCTIFVDYLQYIAKSERSDVDEKAHVSHVSRGLKGLARELKCPVVALSQLSRAVELRANKRPLLSDLRESGAIEQDADVIMFIYCDDYYNQDTKEPGVAEIIVAKQREGSTATAKLRFLKAISHFENISY